MAPATALADVLGETMIANLVRNLFAGLRLIAFMPVQSSSFVIRTDQLISLIFLAIALRLGGALIPNWPITGIWPFGVGVALLRITLLLALLQVVGLIFGQWRSAIVLQVMVLSGAILADIAWSVVANVADWRTLPLYMPFLLSTAFLSLWGVATLRAVRMTFGASWIKAACSGTALLASILLVAMQFEGTPIYKTS